MASLWRLQNSVPIKIIIIISTSNSISRLDSRGFPRADSLRKAREALGCVSVKIIETPFVYSAYSFGENLTPMQWFHGKIHALMRSHEIYTTDIHHEERVVNIFSVLVGGIVFGFSLSLLQLLFRVKQTFRTSMTRGLAVQSMSRFVNLG